MVSTHKSANEHWRAETTKVSLTRHFETAVEDSKARGRDGQSSAVFKLNLRANIVELNHRIRSNNLKFSAYQQILKSKGAKKWPREISLPVVRDRIVLRAMSDLLRTVEPSCSIELAQSKISRVIEALESGEYSHYLKLDVVNFYPTIAHTWLRAAILRTLRSQDLTRLFMSAIETPTLTRSERHTTQKNGDGVPQGLSISNGLAELAIQHVDHAIAREPGVAYFRYVDDILILTKGDLSAELWPKVQSSLALAGLEAHERGGDSDKAASGELRQGFDFLGYSFLWPRVSVRKSSTNRLEGSIARTFTKYKYALEGTPRTTNWPERCVEKLQWHLDLIISGCVFEDNRLGWLAYFSQIRHHQLLEHLDSIVTKQIARHKVTGLVPKKFVASYRHTASRRADSSGFIPNFDTVPLDEMRRILNRIFFVEERTLRRMTSDEIVLRFKKKIRGLVVELERDIQANY